MVSRCGLTVQGTLASGTLTWPTGKESLSTAMVTPIMDRCTKTRPMDMACTVASMVFDTTDSGMKIVAMALPPRLGPPALFSAVSIMMASGMVKVNLAGLMALSTSAIFRKIAYKAKESTPGAMAAAMLANGETVACMALAPSLGATAGNTKVDTRMTRRRDRALSCGPTVAGTRASGEAAAWKAEANCGQPRVVSRGEACGRLAFRYLTNRRTQQTTNCSAATAYSVVAAVRSNSIMWLLNLLRKNPCPSTESCRGHCSLQLPLLALLLLFLLSVVALCRLSVACCCVC
mmetsp:Transcript_4047/g.7627  ORF Transcript_4047/g.7627 Transcript_4047/m.7627 type:complete len:290 (+) Transcript_4047:232-1101(+)